MKLLRVIRSVQPSGGGPVHGILEVSPILASYGIDTTVLCFDDPGAPYLNTFSLPVLALGPGSYGYGFKFGLFDRVCSIFSEYDIIIIDGLWQFHSLISLFCLRRVSTKYCVFVHGMLDPWFKQAFPLKHFKKSIYWLLFEYHLLKSALYVLFTTSTECLSARRSFKPYKVNEFVVGFGANRPELPSSLSLRTLYQDFPQLVDKRIILFFGRIHPKKRPEILIEAFSHIFTADLQYHLVLAGPITPSYKSKLDALVHSLGILPQITWTGMLTGNMKSAILYSSALFCLPSFQENFGVAVAEALSVGLPVAITNSVNIAPLVRSFNAGLVFDCSLSGASSALSSWKSMSNHDHSLLRANSMRLFDEHLSWSVNSRKLVSLLQSL